MTEKKPKQQKSQPKELEAENKALRVALTDAEEGRLRLAADYANLERRLKDETTKTHQRAVEQLLVTLYPIFDNFYRASQHAPTVTIEDLPKLTDDDFKRLFNYLSGIKMIERQLEEALGEAGLKRIAARGELFDPNKHEAISYEPSSQVPADHIIDEVESGWMLGDRVLKPAKVRVSQG